MTAPAPRLAETAVVTAGDTLDDQQWFFDHPGRRYRLRPGWAIRRRGRDTFLRAQLADARAWPDSERLAERLWWEAAYPTLSPHARRRLMKLARPP